MEDFFRSVDNINSYRANSRSYWNKTQNKQNKILLWPCWKSKLESNCSSDGDIWVFTAGTKNHWFLPQDCSRLGENTDQTCYCGDQAQFERQKDCLLYEILSLNIVVRRSPFSLGNISGVKMCCLLNLHWQGLPLHLSPTSGYIGLSDHPLDIPTSHRIEVKPTDYLQDLVLFIKAYLVIFEFSTNELKLNLEYYINIFWKSWIILDIGLLESLHV